MGTLARNKTTSNISFKRAGLHERWTLTTSLEHGHACTHTHTPEHRCYHTQGAGALAFGLLARSARASGGMLPAGSASSAHEPAPGPRGPASAVHSRPRSYDNYNKLTKITGRRISGGSDFLECTKDRRTDVTKRRRTHQKKTGAKLRSWCGMMRRSITLQRSNLKCCNNHNRSHGVSPLGQAGLAGFR